MIGGLTDVLGGVLASLGAENVTIGLALLMGGWYFWKGKKVAGLLGSWGGRLIFTFIVIALLLLTGVLEGVDVDAAVQLVTGVVDVLGDIITEVTN